MNINVTSTATCRMRSTVSASPRAALRHVRTLSPISAYSQEKCVFGPANAAPVVTDNNNAKGADALTRLVSSLEEVPV